MYSCELADSASIITRLCGTTLSASRASIWLLSEDGGRLVCESLYIAAEDRYESGSWLAADTLSRYLHSLRDARIIQASDAINDDRISELSSGYLKPLNIRTVLDVTLRHHGASVGVLR